MSAGAPARTAAVVGAQSPGPLTFRSYRAEDEQAVLTLLKGALGETEARRRNSATWRWKHFNNPFGESFIRVACDASGAVVGLRAFMRWQFWADNSHIDAVQAVDTATRADYRGKGIFSTLTAQAVDEVRRRNIPFIFNTPNVASRSGYLKLGWRYVGTIEPLVCVSDRWRFWPRLVLGTLLRKRGGTVDESVAGAGQCGDNDYDKLADLIARHEGHVARPGRLRTRWTPEFYRWRYVVQPDLTYQLHTIESNGVTRAAAITRVGSRFGLSEVLLSELWTAEPDATLISALLATIRETVKADYMLAITPPQSFVHEMLKGQGFAPIWQPAMDSMAERLMKGYQKPRRLVVRMLGSTPGVNPSRFENWDLSVGDLEIF
jgi:GNAT superfamily N-acetyltransferase